VQAYAARAARLAAWFKQPAAQQCCAAAGWVRQRVVASYQAQHGYYSLVVMQVGHVVAAPVCLFLPACADCAAAAGTTLAGLSLRRQGSRAAKAHLLRTALDPAQSVLFVVHPSPDLPPCLSSSAALPLPPPPHVEQSTEEVAAAQARRKAVIVAEPMLPLELSGELQQAPPRMDMCSECARLLQEVGGGWLFIVGRGAGAADCQLA